MDADALVKGLTTYDFAMARCLWRGEHRWPLAPLIESDLLPVNTFCFLGLTRSGRTAIESDPVEATDGDDRDFVAHCGLISVDCSCGSPETRWKTTGNCAACFNAAWSSGLFTAISTGPSVDPLATISPTSHARPWS